MITVEELFERVRKHQEKFRGWSGTNFWQVLWLILSEIVYYGGADILFNGKVYKVKTEDDAVILFLDIYDVYKDVYKKPS